MTPQEVADYKLELESLTGKECGVVWCSLSLICEVSRVWCVVYMYECSEAPTDAECGGA